MTQYPPTPPQPLPPTPTTWPPSADAPDRAYVSRLWAQDWDSPEDSAWEMPPLVFPRPMTDPALVGTPHDSRHPAGPPDVPQLPASG